MTDFAISTNEPEKLENWRLSNTQGARAFRVHAQINTTGPYGLTWSHREIVEDSLAIGARCSVDRSPLCGQAGGCTSVQPVTAKASDSFRAAPCEASLMLGLLQNPADEAAQRRRLVPTCHGQQLLLKPQRPVALLALQEHAFCSGGNAGSGVRARALVAACTLTPLCISLANRCSAEE